MKKTRDSDSYWHQRARQFSRLYTGQSLTHFPDRIVAMFLQYRTDTLIGLLPTTPFKHVLDLGCGSGVHMKLLSPRCCRVTGIDYSRQMLALARQTLKKTKKKNWRLVRADARAIPFLPRTFDGIIAMGLLDYVTSPLKVLMECRRVMTDGGVILASMPKKPSVFSVLRNPVGDIIKRIIFHLPPIDNAVTKQTLRMLFRTAGFRVITVTSVWHTMWMVKAQPL